MLSVIIIKSVIIVIIINCFPLVDRDLCRSCDYTRLQSSAQLVSSAGWSQPAIWRHSDRTYASSRFVIVLTGRSDCFHIFALLLINLVSYQKVSEYNIINIYLIIVFRCCFLPNLVAIARALYALRTCGPTLRLELAEASRRSPARPQTPL